MRAARRRTTLTVAHLRTCVVEVRRVREGRWPAPPMTRRVASFPSTEVKEYAMGRSRAAATRLSVAGKNRPAITVWLARQLLQNLCGWHELNLFEAGTTTATIFVWLAQCCVNLSCGWHNHFDNLCVPGLKAVKIFFVAGSNSTSLWATTVFGWLT